MPTSRRTLLRATGASLLGALAGCAVGAPAGDQPTVTPAPVPPHTPASTRRYTALPDRTPAFPDGPKDPPDRPDDLTAATASEYVEAYHYRYVYNSLWFGSTTIVHLDCTVKRVEDVGVGFRVAIHCTGWSESNEVHADHFTQLYEYLVDDDSLVRRYLASGTATPTSTPSR